MRQYQKRQWILAACLAHLAGYMDVIGFIQLGGFFVSFMSGNSTRLAVGLTNGNAVAATAGTLILLFVSGAMLGAIVARTAVRWRRPAVLACVTVLIGISAAMQDIADDAPTIACMTLAMGALNAVFLRDGEVSVGVTYMTGTLVKLGHALAAALVGKDRWGWLPYMLLWSGLMSGALLGAFAHRVMAMNALWPAALFCALIGVGAMALSPSDH